MATELKSGQSLPLSIRYLDQAGAAMAATPTPDSPPSWAIATGSGNTLTAAPDGNSASFVAGTAAGSDTARVQVTVGGQQFSATIDVAVIAAEPAPPAQTLTSIEIVAGTPS